MTFVRFFYLLIPSVVGLMVFSACALKAAPEQAFADLGFRCAKSPE